MTFNKAYHILKSGFSDFLSILFPSLCVSCLEKSIDKEQLLCVRCLADIPYTDHFQNMENKVIEHFYGRIPITYGASLLYFAKNSKVKNLLYNFKYMGDKPIGRMLGVDIGRRIKSSSLFNNIDLMIPIPIHESKRIQRGFNQSEIIAFGISEKVNFALNTGILVKLYDTDTQTFKNRIERMENVKHSFGINKKNLIKDKHILLVDDVITTGATLGAAGRILLDNGAKEISVVTVGAATTNFL